MPEPLPLREAQSLGPKLHGPPPASSPCAEEAGRDPVLARAHCTRLRWSLLSFEAFAAAAGTLLVLSFGCAPAQPLTVDPGGQLVREASGALLLSAGTARGGPSADLRTLRTPQGTLAWAQAAFRVAVETARTRVVVEQGEVRWRDANGEQLLRAGATLEAPPRPLDVPLALKAPALEAAEGACASREGAAHRACLREVARGDDLAAQTALFELALGTRGTPSATVEAYRVYLRRFPKGALMPAARVQLLVTLAQAGRRDEAQTEARGFLAQLPDDALAPAVAAFAHALDTER